MQEDPVTPRSETPLGDLLPSYVTRVLAKNGVHTVEGVKRAYPDQLLKMRGMGMLRFREIEGALFPGKSFNLERIYPPAHHVKGSSLNGPLTPRTVRVLARAGITSVEELRATDLKQLLKIEGLGMVMLRDIERVYLMGQRREP